MIPNNVLGGLVLFSKLLCRTPRTPLSLFGNCGKCLIYAELNTQVLNMYEAPC